MTETENKFLNDWSKTRAKGFWLHLFKIVLYFVITFPIASYLFFYSWSSTKVYNLSDFETHLFSGLFGGLTMGIIAWYSSEKKYKKLKGFK